MPFELQNPSQVNPPSTDAGEVPNLKWNFALSKARKDYGGYIREQVRRRSGRATMGTPLTSHGSSSLISRPAPHSRLLRTT